MIRVNKTISRGCKYYFERPSIESMNQVASEEAKMLIGMTIDQFELLTEKRDVNTIEKGHRIRKYIISFVLILSIIMRLSSFISVRNERMKQHWNIHEIDKLTEPALRDRVEKESELFFEKEATNSDLWKPIQTPPPGSADQREVFSVYIKRTDMFKEYSMKVESIVGVNMYDVDMVKMFLEMEAQHLNNERYMSYISTDISTIISMTRVGFEFQPLVLMKMFFSTAFFVLLLLLNRFARISRISKNRSLAYRLVSLDNMRLYKHNIRCIVDPSLASLTFLLDEQEMQYTHTNSQTVVNVYPSYHTVHHVYNPFN